MNRKSTIIIYFLLTVILLSACSTSSQRVGWSCINPSGELNCTYRLFSGKEIEKISLENGEKLTVDFDVQIESGEVKISLQNPEGVPVWDTGLSQTTLDIFSIEIKESGDYLLIVEGIKSRGSFIFDWEIED